MQEFIWHGGEPLLFPVTYYEQIFQLQQEILGRNGIKFKNRIQTNLYRLTPDWLAFLKSGAFDSVGVSFDGIGDLRVAISGASSSRQVADNIQLLKDGGIRFGLLTVLSRATLPYVEHIFDFAAAITASIRFIPIYREAEGRSNSELACSTEEIVEAYERIYLRWMESDAQIDVQPLGSLVRTVARAVKGAEQRYYNKARDNRVFIVNTDGTLYGNADPYANSYRFLNVFSEDLLTLPFSEGWQRSVRKAEARVDRICSTCSLFGICDGYAVAEATDFELSTSRGASACGVVRPSLAFILQHAESSVRGAAEEHA